MLALSLVFLPISVSEAFISTPPQTKTKMQVKDPMMSAIYKDSTCGPWNIPGIQCQVSGYQVTMQLQIIANLTIQMVEDSYVMQYLSTKHRNFIKTPLNMMQMIPLTALPGIGPVGASLLGKYFNSPLDLILKFQTNEEEFARYLCSFGIQYRWSKETAAALKDWTNQHLASHQAIKLSFNSLVHLEVR